MKKLWLLSTLLLAGLIGCAGDSARTAPVRGTVSYKGKLLTHGTVLFVPDKSGPSATGEIQKDGTYVLKTHPDRSGAVLGPHTIAINASEDTSARLPEDRNPLPSSILPEKYSNNTKSGLKKTVEDKDNVFDFHLK
jgi:hypothetical protein